MFKSKWDNLKCFFFFFKYFIVCLYLFPQTNILYLTCLIYTIHIESLMSCHLLLNLLHELANMILCEALPSIISFLPTNVINLVINDNEFEILFIT